VTLAKRLTHSNDFREDFFVRCNNLRGVAENAAPEVGLDSVLTEYVIPKRRMAPADHKPKSEAELLYGRTETP